MNASPLALTRSSTSAFCSSDPSRLKQTTENGRGATTSHPGSSRTQPSKIPARRTASRIRACKPSRPVTAQDGPELQRPKPPAQSRPVLAQVHGFLVLGAQVLGNERHRRVQVVGPP